MARERGRPKSGKEPCNRYISACVSNEDLKRLSYISKKTGIDSKSAIIRKLINEKFNMLVIESVVK